MRSRSPLGISPVGTRHATTRIGSLSGTALAGRVCELIPKIRVLFMSGYADDVVTRNGSLTAGSAFLEKPFSANELAAKVRETLDAA